MVAVGDIGSDSAQLALVARLDRLSAQLSEDRRGLLARLTGRKPLPLKGLYIYGDVGRGKTMLMDAFFALAPVSAKRRVHFNAFMGEVQDRIHAARASEGDAIEVVAAAFAAEARLLCLDEVAVTDIADAMIVGRLFKALFENQVVVVTTSNVHPRDLYKNGLNRPLFLPFIDLLQSHMDVEELAAAKDFRLEKLAGKPLYFTPADARAKAEMDRIWSELTGGQAGAPLTLIVKGRKLMVPQAAMGVARFSFDALCGQPLGTIDYLALAHQFHTLMIDGIPVLTRRDVARRFINLIDTLYDTRTGLVVSAEAEPDGLYPVGDVRYLFERTISRLIEMRSESYLAARSERLAAPVPA